MLTLVIPMPPSVNGVWRQVGRGKVAKSKAYDAWISEAGWALNRQTKEPFEGDVEVRLSFGPRDKRRDLDNCAKAPLDLLQSHGVILNDNQVVRLTLQWSPVVRGCQIDIRHAPTAGRAA